MLMLLTGGWRFVAVNGRSRVVSRCTLEVFGALDGRTATRLAVRGEGVKLMLNRLLPVEKRIHCCRPRGVWRLRTSWAVERVQLDVVRMF